MTPDLATRLLDAQRVTDRLVVEAVGARQSWALFEALNGKEPSDRDPLAKAANHLGLGRPLQAITVVLVRETLQSLMRITDQPGKGALTLCRLSGLLEHEDVRDERIATARMWIPGSPATFAAADAKTCSSAISFIRSLVPPDWKQPPKDTRLLTMRIQVKTVRDTVLAHALDTSRVQHPIVDEVRAMVGLVSQLVQSAELVVRGSAGNWENDFRIRLKEATELWDLCQAGVVRGFS